MQLTSMPSSRARVVTSARNWPCCKRCSMQPNKIVMLNTSTWNHPELELKPVTNYYGHRERNGITYTGTQITAYLFQCYSLLLCVTSPVTFDILHKIKAPLRNQNCGDEWCLLTIKTRFKRFEFISKSNKQFSRKKKPKTGWQSN